MIQSLADLQTPALVLDAGKLQRNIDRMAGRARELGVALRPHLKTPKSVNVAKLLLAAGAKGFNVSTIKEAEYFYSAGINDLFYCVPLAPQKVGRAMDLINQGCTLALMTDSFEGAQAAVAAAKTLSQTAVLPFVLEIDVDGYRSGAPLTGEDIIKTAHVLQDSGVTRFAGIMSYAGASYGKTPTEATELAELHTQALANTRQLLEDAALPCEIVSLGSTPAVLHARHLRGVTEARCGIYSFQDLFQAGIGACEVSDIALSVLSTVISRQPQHKRFIIDAGGLALSKDRSTAGKPFDASYGLVCDAESGEPIDDLIVTAVSQELGLVSTKSGKSFDQSRFTVGSQVRILPNHADMTAAAYESYFVVNGSAQVESEWQRTNRWAP